MADAQTPQPDPDKPRPGMPQGKKTPPADVGVLSDAEKEALRTWFSSKWRQGNCPVCDANQWILPDRIMEIRAHAGGAFLLGGMSIEPILEIICRNCGNTISVNAFMAGVVKKSDYDS